MSGKNLITSKNVGFLSFYIGQKVHSKLNGSAFKQAHV
jgi:hypothetical protein